MVRRLILFLVLVLVVPSLAKTRGEIKSETKILLAKDGADTSFYPDTVWSMGANKSLEFLANNAEAKLIRDTLIVVNGQGIYALNSNFLKVKSVHRFYTGSVLSKINGEDAGQIATTSPTTGLNSTQYHIEAQNLTLYPIPLQSGESLLVWYYAMAKWLTLDTMTADILPIYQDVACYFAADYVITRETEQGSSYLFGKGMAILNGKRQQLGLPPVDIFLEPRVIKQ